MNRQCFRKLTVVFAIITPFAFAGCGGGNVASVAPPPAEQPTTVGTVVPNKKKRGPKLFFEKPASAANVQAR